jgi:organic radical activating enzyme
MDCTWKRNGLREGQRQVIIRLPACALDCEEVAEDDPDCDLKGNAFKQCEFYKPHLPYEKRQVLATEENPIDVDLLVEKIYSTYLFSDVSAICITGGDPLSDENWEGVKRIINTIRSNPEETIEIIIETTGFYTETFMANADFFANNRVAILLKTYVPPKPTPYTDKMFENAGICLSEIISRRMSGDYLKYSFLVCLDEKSDFKVLAEYIDTIQRSFDQADLANDLVRIVVNLLWDSVDGLLYDKISGLFTKLASEFDYSNLKLVCTKKSERNEKCPFVRGF